MTKILSSKRIIWYVYLVLLVFPCFEIALRIIGARPYINTDYNIDVVPIQAFLGHDSLGIQLNPGKYSIAINKGINFIATHEKKQTRKVVGSNTISGNSITMLGCSFTYGFGVNDDEHFTSLLQMKYTEHTFCNLGVIGYGTVQSYLQLKHLLDTGSTDIVILNFSSFHFDRNALTPNYRMALKVGYNRSQDDLDQSMRNACFPYCIDEEKLSIKFEPWEDLYNHWLGREHLASINWLQTQRDTYENQKYDLVSISFGLINKMHAICQEHGVAFRVVCLDKNYRTWLLSKMVESQGILWRDVNFNFQDSTITNLPYDSHPNAIGHQVIADSIDKFISNFLY